MAGDGLHYDGGEDSSESDEYKQAAEEAFPDQEWTPERIDSLKALIKMIAGGESMDEDEETEPDHKSGLALIFGGKPKK